jgi:hypothetical protein
VAWVRLNELREHHSWCFIIVLLNKNGEAIVGLIVKLNEKITLHTEGPCVCVVKLANKFKTNPLLFVVIKLIYLYIYVQSLLKRLDNKASHIVPL